MNDDVLWGGTYLGSSMYQFVGASFGGQFTTVQSLQPFCRSGRGGGCSWTDHGGTTTFGVVTTSTTSSTTTTMPGGCDD